MQDAFFTIDTDNAVIRLYRQRVLEITQQHSFYVFHRLLSDLETMASALSREFSVTFRVEVVF